MKKMRSKKKISIFEVNVLYLLLGILLLTVGSYAQSLELFSGLLITEFLLILLPCLLFLKLKGVSIKKTLKLNSIGLKQIILVMGITIFTYPLAVVFQAIFVGFLNVFRDLRPNVVPLPDDGIQYVISFLIMALAPGICEEVMFRGLIMDAYRSIGYKKSIIISALLFGMFHFNLLNFIGPTILGIIFGIMVYKTNSLYSSIIGHTLNNGIALTIGFFLNRFQNEIDDAVIESTVELEDIVITKGDIIAPFILLLLCFFAVKFMLDQLEPLDKDLDQFTLENIEDIDYSTDLNYFEDLTFESNKTGVISYLPVMIVVILFAFINWFILFA